MRMATQSKPESQNRTVATLLKSGPFRRLWAAQFSTVIVVYSLSLASAALVEKRTHSSTQTGLVILSSILPAFLASLISGAVVDRWGRVPVLMISHLARALVALLFWAGTRWFSPTWAMIAIYAVNMTAAVFSQFSMPAELSLLPDLAGKAHLVTANALFQFSMLAGEGLGIIVLSPLVIKLAGAPTVGLVGAGLFLLAFLLVATLAGTQSAARPARETQQDGSNLWLDLQAGWRTIARDRQLTLVALQATVAATLLLVLVTLLPGLVSRQWGLSVESAPILMLPGGLGFVLGTSLLSRWEKRLSRMAGIALGLAGMGVGVGLLGLLSDGQANLSLIVPLIALIGLAMSLVVVPARTILQERPPAPMRGRVIAAQLALANAAAVLPLLMGGAMADHLGIRPVMGLLGAVALGAGAIGLHQARV
jgi:MFS family permease